GWTEGRAILGFAGSSTTNPVSTVTRRYVGGDSGTQVTTTYFRHTFTLDSTNNISKLQIEILRDDGAVVYLNGVEILRENMNPGPISYSTYSATVVSSPDQNTYFVREVDAGHLLRKGQNTLAVEVHQCNATSSDLYFDFSMTVPAVPGYAFAEITITNDMVIKARTLNGSEWSALSENVIKVQRPPVNYSFIRVSELMYAPPPTEPGSPFSAEDFAWIELRNTGPTAVNLGGVRFVAGITHTFEPLDLMPGARLVLVKNPSAFATRYQTNNITVVRWASGNLARNGETLSLVAPNGTNILTFSYSRVWYPETFATGLSLVVVDSAAPEQLWSTPENWRPARIMSVSYTHL
ncbi:MAG: lamin tail domain-containing protein, partial [Verrucomicrobiae bacterium]|nr:lamin tail domain-containing protein [Verrucomicrobiae bacterium]